MGLTCSGVNSEFCALHAHRNRFRCHSNGVNFPLFVQESPQGSEENAVCRIRELYPLPFAPAGGEGESTCQ